MQFESEYHEWMMELSVHDVLRKFTHTSNFSKLDVWDTISLHALSVNFSVVYTTCAWPHPQALATLRSVAKMRRWKGVYILTNMYMRGIYAVAR